MEAQLLPGSNGREPHIKWQDQVAECLGKKDLKTVAAQKRKAQTELIQAIQETWPEEETWTEEDLEEEAKANDQANATWTEEEANALGPPNSSFYKDNFNGRWKVWYGEGPREKQWVKTKCWGANGNDNHCVQYLLKQVWEWHESITREERPLNFNECLTFCSRCGHRRFG